ncbi:DinB family protein [Kribbella antibiotica]|uniref:DinB family protein n=1 Tax=Kribbella antibiotica TaxID=190195 RepID=UPI001EDD7E97|nr:DinB family protein [Kribbella antibiotica]
MTRTDPPTAASERDLLQGFLDFHRQTLLLKVADLSAEQLVQRSAEPSSMSLLGLVRHLTEVEQYWFKTCLTGEVVPDRYWTDEHPDGDFDLVDPAQADKDLQIYQDAVRESDRIVSRHALDDPFRRPRREGIYSVRYLYIHMIEEYARHNGHADLLRERIDGRVGE